MIVLILIFGLVLRLINLNQSLWLDEAITALAVKNNSFVELITKFAPGDFHPPLYYLLLKLWTDGFGYSEMTLRFPSIIFSLGSIYAVFLIGRKIAGQKVGLIAGLFMSINPLAVYYAQEARMYSLALLAVCLLVYFFLKKQWFWFSLSLLVTMYTDYLPWLMLPVFLFVSRDKRPVMKAYIFSAFLVIPWLFFFGTQLSGGLRAISSVPAWAAVLGSFSLKSLLLVFVKFAIGRISFDNKYFYAGVMLPVAAFFLWIVTRVRSSLLWLWFVLPILLALVISIAIPAFSYFRLLFLLPAFILLLAIGTKRFVWATIGVVAIFLCTLLYFDVSPKFFREDWRSAVAYMAKDRGLVVMPSTAQSAPIEYYNPSQVVVDLNNLNTSYYQRAYLVRYVQEIFDPSNLEVKYLESHRFQKVAESDFGGIVVWTYQKANL